MAFDNRTQTYTFSDGQKLKAFAPTEIPAMYYLAAQGEIIALQHGVELLEIRKFIQLIKDTSFDATLNNVDKLSKLVTYNEILEEKMNLYLNQISVLRVVSFYYYLDKSEITSVTPPNDDLINKKIQLIMSEQEAMFFFIKIAQKLLKKYENITDIDFQDVLKVNESKKKILDTTLRQ
jgi:hypothetical protein